MHAELNNILNAFERSQRVVCATIVAQYGSAPRTSGTKMLVVDGQPSGTIGGGLLEAKTLQACQELMHSGRATLLEFDLSGEMSAGADMICGGNVSVFVEELLPDLAELFQSLKTALDAGHTCYTLTHLNAEGPTSTFQPSHTLWVPALKRLVGQVLPEHLLAQAQEVAKAALRVGNQSAACVAELEGQYYALELWPVAPHMVLAGGGHVSLATAQVAALAGFEVSVLDDRAEYIDPARFPDAKNLQLVPEFTNCFAHLDINARTYLLILSRGHSFDTAILAQALKTSAGYIGMIGSRRKRDAVYESLRQQGFTSADFARVNSPVGLDIHAETPGEIAVSIVAECIQHRRQA